MDKTITPSELLEKIEKTERIMWLLYRWHLRQSIDIDFYFRWMERLSGLKLKLITQAKEEWFREQRKKVVFEQSGVMMSLHEQNPALYDKFKDIWTQLINAGLTAPEP